jgi:glucose/arabinose dehydrogenase
MQKLWIACTFALALGVGCSGAKKVSDTKGAGGTPSSPGTTPAATGGSSAQTGATPTPTGTTPGQDAGSTPSNGNSAGPVPQTCKGTSAYTAYVSDPQLCVYIYADKLGAPRQMAFAPNGDLFVNNGSVIALWDDNHDGHSEMTERATFGTASGLRHGIAFSRDNKFVYASSESTVYRFTYEMGQRMPKGSAEVVIKNIPTGGHNTRTLVFDSKGRLYVGVGSASNVDTQQQQWDTRAQVRRYTLPTVPAGGVEYMTGEVVASGMRNEVGLYVDAQDRVWGVENGRDDLMDADFGGDIHNDNPGEEINLIDGQGSTFYGYPLCYSERNIQGGKGPGTQWADQTLAMGMQKTDAWCQDPANVHPPAFSMQGHWAPLGIVQYTGQALPFAGDFIVAAHGSWDRQPATGRVLARAHVQGGKITAVDPIVGEADAQGKLKQGTWDARPVDVQQGPDQALYFSDDLGGRVFKVGYKR